MKIVITEEQIKNIVNEVLKDDIPSYMSDIIQKRYSNMPNILDKEVPKHTDQIPSVKMEIKDDKISDKIKRNIVYYFTQNVIEQYEMSNIAKELNNNKPLLSLMTRSVNDPNMVFVSPKANSEGFDKTPLGVIGAITKLYTKDFLLPTPQSTDINNPVFGKNKSGIVTFLKVSKKIYPELSNMDVDSLITDKRFVGLREPIINYHINLNKLLNDIKLYLYITDKPDDKLRMSISTFYDSCQNIYSGGDYGTPHNKKLLSNVFDTNSKVAYLIYNVPFKDKMGNEHPFSSVARTIIRVKDKNSVMFDAVYPSDMETQFYKIIEDMTGLKDEGEDGDVYHYSGLTGLPHPYMDKYEIKTSNEIVGDDKILALVRNYDLTPVSDYEFTYGDDNNTINVFRNRSQTTDKYKVVSGEDMEEKCRDYLLSGVSEYLDFEDLTITEMLDKGFIKDWYDLIKIIKRIDYYHDNEKYDGTEELDVYLSDEYGIKSLKDFEILVNTSGMDIETFYRENLDIDKAIKAVGGYRQIIFDMYHNIIESGARINYVQNYESDYYMFKLRDDKR